MKHLSDLQAEAQLRVDRIDPNLPLQSLLRHADECDKLSRSLLDWKRPDRAFVEHIVALEILVTKLPAHKDATTIHETRGSIHQVHRRLQIDLYSQEDRQRWDDVKRTIKDENLRTAASPEPPSFTVGSPNHRPTTSDGRLGAELHFEQAPPPSVGSTTSRNSTIMSAVSRGAVGPNGVASGRSSPADFPSSPRQKPPVRPKPEALHGRAAQANGYHANGSISTDPLSERFARLRPSVSTEPVVNGVPNSRHSGTFFIEDSPVHMPSPSTYSSAPSPAPTSRLTGPRDMPNGLAMPPRPPKLPLNTRFDVNSMPTAPTAAYSPARNMQTPDNINPPRSSARSIVGTGGRSNSIAASNASSHAPGNDARSDSYFPHGGDQSRRAIRRRSVNGPVETAITAEQLFDYMSMYNTLLIDIRPREEFDEGHIYARSVLCIEPTALRPGMSAEQLMDSLILSPDDEQRFFNDRDKFDIVVYYDQSHPDTSFLRKTTLAEKERIFKILYNTLEEFNDSKPLRTPPVLLQGGLDAWTSLLGASALRSSNTAEMKTQKAARPVGRVPGASSSSRLYIQKKRREYNPLAPEEERSWMERARSESAAIKPTVPEEIEEGDEEESVPIYRTTDDFMRRYPEASELERQSMVSPPARRTPPPPPVSYQTSMPSIPSRPAPAAPRLSYSGAHERRNAAPQVNRSQLQEYIPPEEQARNQRLSRTGLINFGNSCYLNATIQCMNATLPLTRLFRANLWDQYVQRNNWKSSHGVLSHLYANLIQAMWAGDVKACRPTTLKKFIGRIKMEWANDEQQDAGELFGFLIDILHEDLNGNWSNPPAHILSTEEEQRRESMGRAFASQVEWSRYTKREKSPLTDLFAGQYASRLKCRVCKTTSTTYEAFWSLNVEIPHSGAATIQQCLQSFTAEEALGSDDKWKCPRCMVNRDATKKITITRVPPFLVIQFNRFTTKRGVAGKICTPVDFPLQGLDLQPYMLPPPTPEEVANCPAGLKRDVDADVSLKPPYRYDAYAVMRHIGHDVGHGHYVALCKDQGRGCWRKFNDAMVTDFEPEKLKGRDRLQSEEAYVVFFERDGGAKY
ncbi:cysteine proteinase [Aulographum hederae CBS 113979]|uniref:Cysteine proteinase n=1 Tax=Aulographum hederae CBS 113979 TaxID=1176131 RepID=A0A6G1GMZ2_9PEZI|nr:cysteine proteinase [Aulographum hederae CBS 113979]